MRPEEFEKGDSEFKINETELKIADLNNEKKRLFLALSEFQAFIKEAAATEGVQKSSEKGAAQVFSREQMEELLRRVEKGYVPKDEEFDLFDVAILDRAVQGDIEIRKRLKILSEEFAQLGIHKIVKQIESALKEN